MTTRVLFQIEGDDQILLHVFQTPRELVQWLRAIAKRAAGTAKRRPRPIARVVSIECD